MAVKIRERPKDSGIYWIFIDHKGKRKAKKVGKDRRLAGEAAKKIEAKLLLGQLDLDKKEGTYIPTLREYVLGWTDRDGRGHIGWLDKYARLALKLSTWSVYENLLKVHILPQLGNHSLDQISSRDIADMIVKKVNSGLRNRTVKNIKNCLSSILQYVLLQIQQEASLFLNQKMRNPHASQILTLGMSVKWWRILSGSTILSITHWYSQGSGLA